MESSITRAAPDCRAAVFSDGGVRPAARWPASVRSRNPSCDVIDASARTSGLPFFPPAVRGDFDFLAPARFRGSAIRAVYGVEPRAHRGELPEPPATQFTSVHLSVVILLADGVRPDTLEMALA